MVRVYHVLLLVCKPFGRFLINGRSHNKHAFASLFVIVLNNAPFVLRLSSLVSSLVFVNTSLFAFCQVGTC
jgi:hypothetical protein